MRTWKRMYADDLMLSSYHRLIHPLINVSAQKTIKQLFLVDSLIGVDVSSLCITVCFDEFLLRVLRYILNIKVD